MPIGDGEEPKSLLTVCKAKSESTVPSKSENPSRSKGPLTTATPLRSTSTSPEVPRSAPSTKAAKSVVSPHFTRASGRMAQAEGDKALRKFMTITDRIRVYNGSNDPPKSSSLIQEQCIQMPSLQGSPRSEGLPTVSSTAIGEAVPRGTN
ncbi:uncharacterized protein [Drosophila kikkawai]|uniref:Uncharacterized protein n=1 Tax=Drosophila kikkawai TaxID=30033 RepID=A0ABM4GPQ8_DROKI